jgi:hypothetical protein
MSQSPKPVDQRNSPQAQGGKTVAMSRPNLKKPKKINLSDLPPQERKNEYEWRKDRLKKQLKEVN